MQTLAQVPPPQVFKSNMAGLSVKFSPFNGNTLAYSCAQNFGIVGKGKLLIFQMSPNGQLQVVNDLNEQDAIFDCAWSENNEAHVYIALLKIFTAGGKGTLNMWNLMTNQIEAQFQAHQGETQSVECNHKYPNLILSSGADGKVKLFDLIQKRETQFYNAHIGQSYQSTWHPNNPNVFASVGQDGFMKLWDTKSQQKCVLEFKCHDQEILCCDFNKYVDVIVTGSIDKSIKIWDLRNLQKPVNALFAHRYPVRKVKCSPHEESIILSGSYDMNVNVFDTKISQQSLVFEHNKHTEFVIGVDFSLFHKRMVASTGYDGRCLVWNWDQPQPQIL